MIRKNQDALTCDFAEYYHVFDFKTLPPTLAAVLAVGLGINSRIKTELSGSKLPLELLLQARIADSLALLWWGKTQDGQHNRRRPASIVQLLLDEDNGGDVETFENGEDFKAARQRIVNEIRRKGGTA